ncbi:MAG: hypothetical protein A3D44_00720 [Candidatus Staskawiczbacteria bacterium RIFCSPHIGHO2_02_FULL_42_22]|uniref:Uncharacterized protein n=1 Tax=Candidatus Staskawiczbacteria bacterium RIFCSPHIGHO2_02_FULL_42_22 TaxID=1802207 RepID=A0A1G2I1X4_9BACT|nr:MAG: hypothetical protein A3D44_00720 [Candidatus Staskawiczbacteria bacterium RIFCSPHIGHO2_02_FULL_42_22]
MNKKIYLGTVSFGPHGEFSWKYHFHAHNVEDADRILRTLFFEDKPEYRDKSGDYDFAFVTSVEEIVLRKPKN